MKYFSGLFLLISLVSCGSRHNTPGGKIITVSIAPFKYFVEEIGGNDFRVNVMVPSGADPHVYEPFPEQISELRRSSAYISNGFLGFEMNWLDRFYESNKTMVRLSLGDKINLLVPAKMHEGNHVEGADPHFWVSPVCASVIAQSVRDLLITLNPSAKSKYEANYLSLIAKIRVIDDNARKLFSGVHNKSFMIYHPNLAYIARDYGLQEISVEFEGKEPPPSRLKELIDLARKEKLMTIFVQREYDTKNARSIASEIGASITIIDPLSEDWQKSTNDIISKVYKSLMQSSK
jgi:zinc transport system substrate-binding protein